MQVIRRELSKLDGCRVVLSLSKPKPISLGLVLEKQARKQPQKPAILFEDRVITYGEFNEQANRYAHFFQRQGLSKGDVVALLMENRPEYLIVVAGLAKLGITISLVNTGVRGRVLAHAINICEAKSLIMGQELLSALEEVASEIHFREPGTLYLESEGEVIQTALPLTDLGPLLKDMPITNPDTTPSITSEDLLFYIYTSGTTGFPKATGSKHQNWLALGYGSGGICLTMLPEDVLYNCLPLYHNSGSNIAFASFLTHGSAIALRRKFSARNFWKDINKYQATHFIYVGELCRYLNNQPPHPDDSNNPLQYILGNGMRGDYWPQFKKRFGIKRIIEVYGASEGVARIINTKQIPGMMGRLTFLGIRIGEVVQYDVENEQIRCNNNGTPIKCKPSETGLLLCEINARAAFAGYVNNPAATEAKIMRNVFLQGDEYFDSGDLIKLHQKDWVSFVDRLGDTYRWKGENVSTNEVADVLNSFDGIEDSNVYGVEVEGTEGRCGMVALSLLEDAKFDLGGFADFVSENLPVYARPYFLRLRDQIDATGSFKQLKIALKKEGFDPALIKDPLYFLDPRQGTYVPISAAIYEDIINQRAAF
ncbi:MAG: long-chain-acyl-CoA synthetase [Bacillota bacterium]|nr:long-chain-acyl-CoA synthetase [Bacillota bacterium]